MANSTSTSAIASTAGGPAWGNQGMMSGAPGVSWPATSVGLTGATTFPPMMPVMGAMPGQPSMMMPTVTPSMAYGVSTTATSLLLDTPTNQRCLFFATQQVRPLTSMIPGAISVLPSGVTPATLSSALSNRASNVPSSNSQSVSDPFGAL